MILPPLVFPALAITSGALNDERAGAIKISTTVIYCCKFTRTHSCRSQVVDNVALALLLLEICNVTTHLYVIQK